MSVIIRPMVPADAGIVASCARPADIEEMHACTGLPLTIVLQCGLQESLRAWVIEHDGLPLAAVGDTLAGFGVGVPWMVTTVHIEKNPRGFLRASKALMSEAMQRHYQLTNYVDARNGDAIRWLEWLGFKMEPAVPYGVSGLPFHKFQITREV